MNKTYKVDEVASCLGLSRRRIYQLVKSGILPPPSERGKYDLASCIQAYFRRTKEKYEEKLKIERNKKQEVDFDHDIICGLTIDFNKQKKQND